MKEISKYKPQSTAKRYTHEREDYVLIPKRQLSEYIIQNSEFTTDDKTYCFAKIKAAADLYSIEPLTFAAHVKSHSMLEFLINQGLEINGELTKGHGPLIETIMRDHFKIFQFLLKKGADVNKIDTAFGTTPLITAIYHGNLKMASLLIEKKADVDQPDARGLTPITQAIYKNDLNAVQLLVSKSADIDKIDAGGMLPINLAIYQNNYEIIELLMSSGADMDKLDGRSISAKGLLAHRSTPTEGLLETYKISQQAPKATAIEKERKAVDKVQISLAFSGTLQTKLATEISLIPTEQATLKSQQKQPIDDIEKRKLGLKSKSEPQLNILVRTVQTEGLSLDQDKEVKPKELLDSVVDKAEKAIDPNQRDVAGETLLFKAVQAGDVEKVKSLIELGADVNLSSQDIAAKGSKGAGKTALAAAVESRNIEIVKILLERQAKVDVMDSEGWTLIEHAASGGQMDMVKLLLEHGAKVKLHHPKGGESKWYDLLQANKGLVEIFKADIKSEKPVIKINKANQQGYSPLMIGIFEGDLEKVKLLVELGAEVNFTNAKNGSFALLNAVKKQHHEIVEYLLTTGKALANSADSKGITPLIMAIQNDDEKSVDLLLNNGAAANYCTDNPETPYALAAAIKANKLELVQKLIDRGADKEIVDSHGWTPLMYASKFSNQAIVKYLVDEQKVNLQTTNSEGMTAFQIAIEFKQPETTKYLLHKGDVLKRGESGKWYPVAIAAKNNDTKILELLLEEEFAIDVAFEGGPTGLTAAIADNKLKATTYLLEQGANPKQVDKQGNTPLALAVSNKNKQLIKLLLEKGAVTTIEEINKLPPISGNKKQDKAIRKLLEDNRETLQKLAAATADAEAEVKQKLKAKQSETSKTKTKTKALEKKISSKAATENLYIQLGIAIRQENDEQIKMLLKQFKKEDYKSKIAQTVLLYFIEKGDQLTVNQLLNQGFQVNFQYEMKAQSGSKYLTTPLIEALLHTHFEVATIILEKTNKEYINFRYLNTQLNPLILAIHYKMTEFVEKLLKKGADVKIRGINQSTTLFMLIDSNFPKHILELLLEHPDIDIEAKDVKGNTALMYACKRNNLESLIVLINKGAKVNTLNKLFENPLIIAAEKGNLPMAKILLQHGATINPAILKGEQATSGTPLNKAIMHHHYHIVQFLVQFGADVNFTDLQGYTPLMLATKVNEIKMLELLLKQEKIEVNAREKNGNSALMIATILQKIDLIDALLIAQADVNCVNNKGQTPLHMAVRFGNKKAIKLLLNAGAKIDALDCYRETPISIAMKNNNDEIKKLLVSKFGVDCETIQEQFFLAVKRGDKAAAELLLKQGADVGLKDDFNNNAILIATRQQNQAMVKLLLSSGAEVDPIDSFKETPLLIATRQNNTAMVELLLNAGAEVDSIDSFRETPLLIATRRKNQVMVKLLLNAGAEVDPIDLFKETPLLIATRQQNQAMVELLLNAGAEVDPTDSFRETPLLIATRQQNQAMVKLLLSQGADIEHKNEFGLSPLMIAEYTNNMDIINLLIIKGADTSTVIRELPTTSEAFIDTEPSAATGVAEEGLDSDYETETIGSIDDVD